jgi:hypothetical protein
MLLRSVLVAIFALPALISGNQFPIANGAIGGVPSESPDACNFKSQKGTFSNDDSTPGQLRVVENSGVCGGVILFQDASSVIFTVSAETSPDVYQASGYGDLTSADKSIWFVLHLEGFLGIFVSVPPTGSGSLLHAMTLTLLLSSLGLMAA